MTTLCIVQARMGSSRLPGKVLEPIGDQPMLEKILARVVRADDVDEVLVATSDQDADLPIVELAESIGVAVWRGPEFDVLRRYAQAAASRPSADTIVRITADCPFTDPILIDQVLALRSANNLDYASNQPADSKHQTFPLGLAVECFAADALTAAEATARERHEREHVTPAIYAAPGARVGYLSNSRRLTEHRWTVDTPEDLEVVRALHHELRNSEPYGWLDVLRVAEAAPELESANRGTPQKVIEMTDSRWRT